MINVSKYLFYGNVVFLCKNTDFILACYRKYQISLTRQNRPASLRKTNTKSSQKLLQAMSLLIHQS